MWQSMQKLIQGLRNSNHTRRPVRPQMELLEDRLVPTVTYHGGHLLTNVQVTPVFLGNAWNNDSAQYQESRTLTSYLGFITNSTYMDMLTNAGYGVNRGSVVGGYYDPAGVGSTLDDSQIQRQIQAEITAGSVPAPNGNSLYFVFTPANVLITAGNENSQNDFLGYHSNFFGRNRAGASADIFYAVIPYQGGVNASIGSQYSATDSFTEVSSHELSEAVTDPDTGGPLGWFDDAYAPEGEIGDIVAHQAVYLNGWRVQKEAGQNDQALVPQGWTQTPQQTISAQGLSLSENAGQPFTDVLASFTDTDPLAAGGAFSVTINWGDGTSSQGTVQVNGSGGYNVVGTHTYTSAGTYAPQVTIQDAAGNATSAAASVTVKGVTRTTQQPVFTMDTYGRLFEYTDQTGWVFTGGAGVAFQVGRDNVGQAEAWVLAGDHSLWRYDQGSWLATGGYLQSIQAGHGEVFGLGYDSQLWYFRDSGGWAASGGFGVSIKVGTDSAGQDEVWLLASGNYLWRFDQGRWTSTGGVLRTIQAGHGEVFGLGYDSQLWYFRDQGGWAASGGFGASFQLGTDAAGQDEVWLLTGDNSLWRFDQGRWAFTGGVLRTITAAHGEVFGIGFDGQLWRFRDQGGWTATGGYGSAVYRGANAAGGDVALVVAGDGSLWRYDDGVWASLGLV